MDTNKFDTTLEGRLKNLEAQIDTLQDVVYKSKDVSDRLEANWDKDRQDFAEFEARLGHVELELKSLRDSIFDLPKRISESIVNATSPMREEMSDFKDAMEDTKIVAITEEKPEVKVESKKHWYFLWLF